MHAAPLSSSIMPPVQGRLLATAICQVSYDASLVPHPSLASTHPSLHFLRLFLACRLSLLQLPVTPPCPALSSGPLLSRIGSAQSP